VEFNSEQTIFKFKENKKASAIDRSFFSENRFFIPIDEFPLS
jgi:hypothetical protein